MIPAPKADVIVPWERQLGPVRECLESVLEYGGPTLRRLFLVAESALDRETAVDFAALAARDSRLEIIANSSAGGFAACCNHALMQRDGDAVLLRGDCVVTRDWLLELSAVAHSEPRTACHRALGQRRGKLLGPRALCRDLAFCIR